MQIYISRDGQQNGPYGIEDINAYLENGTLLPTDLACQDGMTEWVPISQIPGVTMPEDSIATPIPPSQPVPDGNKKKILIGIGAGMGLLALIAGIWFFFIREAGEKGKLVNNTENNPPIKTAKKKGENNTPTSASRGSDPNEPNNVEIEKAIREELKKPTGELTKADLEKVTKLNLSQSTDRSAEGS